VAESTKPVGRFRPTTHVNEGRFDASRTRVRFPAPPPISRLKMASAAILFFRVPRMCRELAAARAVASG
jgi:hypothetical protein